MAVSQATVSRCVRQVALSVAALSSSYTKFPSSRESATVKQRFLALAGFPNVIGAIDECLVKIKKPSQNVSEFVCRKGYPALNCQFTCLPDQSLSSVTGTWPGSCHDSRIFGESDLKQYMESGDHGILLGHSGYPSRPCLLTPFFNPSNPCQDRYNIAHCETRVKAFGILQNRFGCLLQPLRMTPDRAVTIIIAVAVLHNIAVMCRDNFDPINDEDDDDDDNNNGPGSHNAQHGMAVRDHYVNTFFS